MVQSAGKYTKKWIMACNFAISMTVIICVLIGLFLFFAYDTNRLKETTGTIAKFEQRDKEWYDYIASGTDPHLYVWLEDGAFFEAKGISYDKIDRGLFEKIRIGEEITLAFNSRFGRPNRIYAIKYSGKNYLLLDDVLAQYEKSHIGSLIAGILIITLSIAAGGVGLLMVNYKYRKRKVQNS